MKQSEAAKLMQNGGIGDRLRLGMRRAVMSNRMLRIWAAQKSAVLVVTMGFLLGRATILDELSPFAIAYFAVVYFMRKDMLPWTGAALFAGSLLAGHGNAGYLVTQMIVFALIQRGLEKFERSELSHAPLIVLAATFGVQLFAYLVRSDFVWFTLLMTAVQAMLSFVLTLIFIQAFPAATMAKKTYSLKNDEVICLIILLASVLTGTVGWTVYGVSVEHVLSRALILLFALVGGAPLGASVGLITGLILSLSDVSAIYEMSLLAFAGMLAGLLKEGGKPAAVLGMLIGSSILSVYVGSQVEIIRSAMESAAAAALFLLTPKPLIRLLAKYVPGTQENLKSHYEYAKRIRDMTAQRVEQYSEMFRQLSRSFKQPADGGEESKRKAAEEHFMNAVAQRTCAMCWKRKQCWEGGFYDTHRYLTEMMSAVEQDEKFSKKDIPGEWRKVCTKTEQVLGVMKQQYTLYKHDLQWKLQIAESRQLVADQLTGVSQVMRDLAKEIKREGQELIVQEERIRQALEQLGLSIQSIDVLNLEEGNVEIEIVHRYTRGFDECRKIIAPLLSDIIGENITVKRENPLEGGTGTSVVVFGSAIEYEVETGVAGAARGGDLLSGDSFSTVELGGGKIAVAVSDGMGNGERARAESSTALTILQQLLQSGMDEKLAIKSVNSVLMLRSPEEMFATVDMAIIDQYSAKTTFMKIGSTPSFIKRGGDVIQITASNLPVGIVHEIEVDLVTVQLRPGDILIMMTDGIYDAPGYAVNKELWMKRMIQEIDADEPQVFADCLLERIIRHLHGEITDDMTVLVATIERYEPEWATFRWPGVTRLERPKTVS